MPSAAGAWNQRIPRPGALPTAGGYGSGYNAIPGGGNAGMLSNGAMYQPAIFGRPVIPSINRLRSTNFGAGNGPGGPGGPFGGGFGGNGGGSGFYGGGDPF
ncbi:hypothetical protein BKA65DRAFT_592640 [Rhexocercosporidium sp. MPI-PUGE-AT-0058]|nr:hypothetical protein BKA65DRAFT_592640 [Rhexocercosporidium sp. MPI-PUGE-AT-0058]